MQCWKWRFVPADCSYQRCLGRPKKPPVAALQVLNDEISPSSAYASLLASGDTAAAVTRFSARVAVSGFISGSFTPTFRAAYLQATRPASSVKTKAQQTHITN